MADDRATWRKNLPEDFDGKMADTWDGEISVKAVAQTSLGIVLACAFTFAFAWGLVVWNDSRAEAAAPAPAVLAEANERRLPPGARLQSHPEHEMAALRHETEMRLNNYGWVDEAAGTVHIPVETAMHMLVEQAGHDGAADEGEPSTDGSTSDEDAAATEDAPSESAAAEVAH